MYSLSLLRCIAHSCVGVVGRSLFCCAIGSITSIGNQDETHNCAIHAAPRAALSCGRGSLSLAMSDKHGFKHYRNETRWRHLPDAVGDSNAREWKFALCDVHAVPNVREPYI